jgi:hypothetical protein
LNIRAPASADSNEKADVWYIGQLTARFLYASLPSLWTALVFGPTESGGVMMRLRSCCLPAKFLQS